ncbi:MAG: PIG-L deacetylase family protein [Candidatus Scalinduaceae bacterium]
MNKEVPKKSALILVAHADDETLAAGGTICKLVEEGWIVDVVILSDTVRFGGAGLSNKLGAEEACDILGVHNLRILDVPDQIFDTIAMAELSQKVAVLKLEPDLIITNSDQDLNKDHRLTCEAAKIIGRPIRKPVCILSGEIPSAAFWSGNQFSANFYVDISPHIEKKIQAFKHYVHEIQAFPHPWSEEGLRLLAQFRGMECGLPFAEAFTIIRGYAGILI